MLCMVVPYKPAMRNYLSVLDLSIVVIYLPIYSAAILPADPKCPMENYMHIPVVSYTYLCTPVCNSLMISFASLPILPIASLP